ncbi:MAG: cytochrome c biogenesis protein CcsA, partial [Nitrospinota bacterium]
MQWVPTLSPLLYLFSPLFRPLFYLSMGLQAAYVISRGLSLGRVPLVGVHDTLTFLAFSTGLSACFFLSRFREKKAFFKMVALLAFLISLGACFSKPMNFPLPSILKTIWFELHVVLAFASYGLFGVGAVLGILAFPGSRASIVEPYQYKAILIGYFLFSLSMIFGGIWAFLAWANYWIWTPKELWTSLVWILLTLHLHL